MYKVKPFYESDQIANNDLPTCMYSFSLTNDSNIAQSQMPTNVS